MAGFIVCCLAAGFIVFPGWVAMSVWNFAASYSLQVPTIGIFQGGLLWGILVASYFTFRKDKFVVCMRTPQGLNEEELKAVFADIKKQADDEKILQSMLKARETELKLKETKTDSEESNTKL